MILGVWIPSRWNIKCFKVISNRFNRIYFLYKKWHTLWIIFYFIGGIFNLIANRKTFSISITKNRWLSFNWFRELAKLFCSIHFHLPFNKTLMIMVGVIAQSVEQTTFDTLILKEWDSWKVWFLTKPLFSMGIPKCPLSGQVKYQFQLLY